ncbi:MAG: hypothetical protein HXS54_01490 [Theionarchaea archaeon]|nr:hypothetical protein [Theionarchaea archaeon]
MKAMQKKLENSDFSHDLGEKWKIEGYLNIFTWYLDIKLLDTLESFISGFGRFGSDFEPEINNAVFIAIKKLNLNVPLEFRDGGRLGIESLELYPLFDHITTGGKKDEKAFKAGQELSKLNDEELRLIASYFWNEGKSSLFKEERKKARELIEKHFGEVKQ